MAFVKNVLFGGRGTATVGGDLMLAVVRVSLGIFMCVGHGLGKVFPGGSLGPPQGLIDGVTTMGFPMPTLFAWAAGLTEFLGAALLALGLLTRPAAAGLVFTMGVAAFVVHANDPWFMTGTGGSKEPAMLYLFPFLLFLVIGGGRFSIDALLRRPKPRVDIVPITTSPVR